MIEIAIAGAGGRMGREIGSAALSDVELHIAGAFEVSGSPAIGTDIGTLCGRPAIGTTVGADAREAIAAAKVLIEFTTPTATIDHCGLAAELGKAAVIGTTGLSEGQVEQIRVAAKQIPVVMAPNMSVGVHVLLSALPDIVRLLGASYDVEIVETHHRGKQDAPSGTALKLADAIAEAIGARLTDVATYGREGVAPRRAGEIGLHAVRAGGVVGDHQVIFANEGEQIEIIHRAFSRQNFALGALRAAKFVAARAPGLYSMRDVLGCK